MTEIRRYDYRNENISNDGFYFCLNIIGFEFQPMKFLACDFFVRFVRKLAQMIISTFFLESIIEKRKPSFHFSLIKISTSANFMRLRSKLTSEIRQKVRRLDEKMS